MSKNNILIAILLILGSICDTLAQSTLSLKFKRNNVWEDHRDYAVCPGIFVEYQVLNWNASCHTMTVVNGYPEGDATSNVSSDGKITIFWKDTGDSCFVKVQKKTTSNCSSAAGSKNFFIPVLSLTKVKPEITQNPPGKFDVGFIHDITYTVSAQYPWLGKKDSFNLSDFILTEFVWTIPPGWSIISGGQFTTIKVRTDLGTGGKVTAKAINRRCLSSAGYSGTGEQKTERQMPTPCPITADQIYENCGEPIINSFACTVTPEGFQQPVGGVTRTWSVMPPDGWVKLSQSGTSVEYQTDGQKTRTVTVTVSAYGVSSSCSLVIPLRLTNPLTQIKGNNRFCVQDSFKLTHPLPAGASATWKVESLTPGSPSSVSPLTGTGESAVLSVTGGGSLNKISFKVTGCNDSLFLVDTFFAGKPAFYDMRIDGVLGTQAFVCPGTHTASLKLEGANTSCVAWENSGNNPVFFACLEANAYISGSNGSTTLIARAGNECGSNDVRFFLIPKNWGCNGWGWGLSVFPNPTVGQVTIETKLEENSNLTEKPKMNGIRLVNNSGGVAYESFQVGDSFTINLSGVPPGTYTLQTVVEGVPVSETVQVKLQ